jgi:hypothetical protein
MSNNPIDTVCILHHIIKYVPNNVKKVKDLATVNSTWYDTIHNYSSQKWIDIIENRFKRNIYSSDTVIYNGLYNGKTQFSPLYIFRFARHLNIDIWHQFRIIIRSRNNNGYRIGVYKIDNNIEHRYINEYLDGPEIFINISNSELKQKKIFVTEYTFCKNNILKRIKLNENNEKHFIEINEKLFEENVYPSLIKIIFSKLDVIVVNKDEFDEDKIKIELCCE